MNLPFLKPRSARNVSTTVPHVRPAADDKECAERAAAFIMQPFWPEMLSMLAETRAMALEEMRKRHDTWDEDARALEYWRAIDELAMRIETYPQSIIEQGEQS